MYRHARIKGVKVEIYKASQFHSNTAAEPVVYHKSAYDKSGAATLNPAMTQVQMMTYSSYKFRPAYRYQKVYYKADWIVKQRGWPQWVETTLVPPQGTTRYIDLGY